MKKEKRKKIKKKKRWYIGERNTRIRRGGLKGDKQIVFKDKMIKEGKWVLYKAVHKLWNEMSSYIIKRVIKRYLENLKDLCNELKRFGGGMSNFRQQLVQAKKG